MKLEDLRARLADVNLSELARRSGIALRTLRRFKNQGGAGIRFDTFETLRKALRKSA